MAPIAAPRAPTSGVRAILSGILRTSASTWRQARLCVPPPLIVTPPVSPAAFKRLRAA